MGSTISKRQRPSDERESGSPLPDSPEKINEPSESEANSDRPASYADVIGNNYYVFLSFRGPDTRKGFVDHLYHELVRVGLHLPNFVFKDDKNLDLGEPIEMLLSAIKCSKVSIPVISETYAASEWCLREIIQIMECVNSREQKVYPVLYKVTPGDVRHMKGKFGKAFNNSKFDEEIKRKGRVALEELVKSKVIESEKEYSGHEGKLVIELVKKIMRNHQHDFLPSLPQDLVGIDEHVARVMNLADSRTMKPANTASSKAQIIMIYGIGGIGKTTLATTIYNRLFGQFKYRSFLNDIRETIKSKGMKYVQSLHISNLANISGHSEHNSGIEMIRINCDKKKVLILLDDVDRRDHIDNLIGGCNFKSGSWIIITCRDKALLKSEYKEYKLEEMNRINSLALFKRYAFRRGQPSTELLDLSSDIVAITRGLPLALVIIGSFLKGKDKSIWTETLQKLRKVPHTDVQQKLRISFDSLEYEEQQMFLDIACFFIGINKKFAAYFWEDLQYYVDSGLERLIELSLMKIDDDNELRMHDQLRDLGRAIACPANKKAWKCSRLWDEKAIIIQRSKEENRYIEALRLDESGSYMFMNRRSFERMPYLKFLHLRTMDYVGNFEGSLSELRWLKWDHFHDSFLVINIHLENLLILDLSIGDISHEWRGWSLIKMERLKVLNLSHCYDLVRTPNLSQCKSLEILILEDCDDLGEIDPSIGDAKCLTSLNLRSCRKLKELPSQLGELKCLTSLNLSSCRKLKELPSHLGELKCLTSLNLSSCHELKELPPQLGELKCLTSLNLSYSSSLVKLPDSISHLVNLSTLDLRGCEQFKELPESIGSLMKLQYLLLGNMRLSSKLDYYEDDWINDYVFPFNHIPHSIGKLKSLTELHLTCAQILELPESIGDLTILKILKIARCKELIELPSTLSKLGKLEELDATACKSLEGAIPINGLSSLKILRFGKFCHMEDLYWMHEASPWSESSLLSNMFHELSQQDSLQHRDLIIRDHLPVNLTVLEVTCWNHELPQLCRLNHLKELSFQYCTFLKSIPVLPPRILKLCVIYCHKLEKLPSLLSLESLSELAIGWCAELMEIEGLEGLKSLEILFLCECKKLLNLNGLEHLESLRQLEIEDLDPSLMDDRQFQVQCLGGLKNLKRLRIANCQSLKRLDISQLTDLSELLVCECEDVKEINGLEGLKELTYLNISGCYCIERLPHLSLFDNLTELNIEYCWNLEDVQGLERVKTVTLI